MIRPRRRWIAFAVGLLIGIAGFLLLRALPMETVTPENCRRIVNGMTLTEVEAILGRRADSTGEEWGAATSGAAVGPRGPLRICRWEGQECQVSIVIDADGCVAHCLLLADEPEPWYRRLLSLI